MTLIGGLGIATLLGVALLAWLYRREIRIERAESQAKDSSEIFIAFDDDTANGDVYRLSRGPSPSEKSGDCNEAIS